MKLTYQAFNLSGKAVRDVIEAPSVDDAKEQLRKRGLFVSQIGTSSSLGNVSNQGASKKPKASVNTKRLKHMAVFCRQLYVLISSGTRVVEAMEALEQQTKDEHWRKAIFDIRTKVQEGIGLSDACKSHPDYFNDICVNMIEAGESTGKLPEMLQRLSELALKQVHVRKTISGAMVYPILLLFVAIGVLLLMLLFVLPRFTVLFETLKLPLPPTTKMLVFMSDSLRQYWWMGLILLGVLGTGLKIWLGTAAGKRAVDTVVLAVPMLGAVVRSFSTARIARLLGIMLDSYMPLMDVLALIRKTMDNYHYVLLIESAQNAVTQGDPISAAFSKSDLISPTVCQVLRSGEQSGQVAPLLLNMADLMDEENEILVKSLTSVMEPLILIVLGVLVGFVAMSMFLPLFDLMGGPPQ